MSADCKLQLIADAPETVECAHEKKLVLNCTAKDRVTVLRT